MREEWGERRWRQRVRGRRGQRNEERGGEEKAAKGNKVDGEIE